MAIRIMILRGKDSELDGGMGEAAQIGGVREAGAHIFASDEMPALKQRINDHAPNH